MKYNKILKCKLKNEEDIFETYILTYKGCDKCFEIDLCSQFMFNCDYEIIKSEEVFIVNDIEDLEYFLKKNNITRYFYKSVYNKKDNRLYVGGCNDYVLNKDLEVLGWLEDVKEMEKGC